ncbi:MAG: hypothetical protein Q8L77_14475 [Nitrospirota bacterium]|nr:hypothetical protein [Nitrospirota bacterium]
MKVIIPELFPDDSLYASTLFILPPPYAETSAAHGSAFMLLGSSLDQLSL